MSQVIGRYDVELKPNDKNKNAFILEFKAVDNKELESIVEIAKKQIEEKEYDTELKNEGYTNIHKVVIVFKGKDVVVREV